MRVVTTEVITAALGTHASLELLGRVERRTWRVPLGPRGGFVVTRLRPLAIVVGGDGGVTLPITQATPLATLGWRIMLLWLAATVVECAVAPRRAR